MTKAKHTKLEIASKQFETAIKLFLAGEDRYSVITLAGAADAIFTRLVLNAGKEPFVDYARQVHEVNRGTMPPRGKFMSYMNKMMGINSLKHMDEGDAEIVEIDIEKSASDGILKAYANYRQLVDDMPDFVISYLRQRLKGTPPEESKRMMQEYEKYEKEMEKRGKNK